MSTRTTQQVELTDLNFEREVIERLTSIEVKLDADYRALHGNGKPGLLDRVNKLENSMYAGGMLYRAVVSVIAWLITLAVAIYAALKN
jgi:hypothetical protein